ncbi:MAG: galactose oxidase-like domain-containing protein [Pseudomonadota bacterium]
MANVEMFVIGGEKSGGGGRDIREDWNSETRWPALTDAKVPGIAGDRYRVWTPIFERVAEMGSNRHDGGMIAPPDGTIMITGGQTDGAWTHACNSDSRLLERDFTIVDATTIAVTTPAGTIMLPGAWTLYALDANGVPHLGDSVSVNMAPLVGAANITAQAELCGIDDHRINGAFEIKVDIRFDDLAADMRLRSMPLAGKTGSWPKTSGLRATLPPGPQVLVSKGAGTSPTIYVA